MKSIMVGIRFKEDVYQALQARAGKGSVADYIKELVTKSVNSPVLTVRESVNSPSSQGVNTIPVQPKSNLSIVGAYCQNCKLAWDFRDYGRVTCSITKQCSGVKEPACDKWQEGKPTITG